MHLPEPVDGGGNVVSIGEVVPAGIGVLVVPAMLRVAPPRSPPQVREP